MKQENARYMKFSSHRVNRALAKIWKCVNCVCEILRIKNLKILQCFLPIQTIIITMRFEAKSFFATCFFLARKTTRSVMQIQRSRRKRHHHKKYSQFVLKTRLLFDRHRAVVANNHICNVGK